jgi:hypothetical protein
MLPGGADDRFSSSASPREDWQTTENDGLPHNAGESRIKYN